MRSFAVLTATALLAVCSAVRVTVLSGGKGVIHSVEKDILLEQLSSAHVADIFARVAANTPLLAEEKLNLPARDIFAPASGAVLVEVPDTVGPFGDARSVVLRAHHDAQAVRMHEVMDMLAQHKIPSTSAIIEADEASEQEVTALQQASKTADNTVIQLKSLQSLRENYGVRSKLYQTHARRIYKELVDLSKVKPVIVIEREGQAVEEEVPIVSRRLAESSSNSTAPTEEEIARYQITLWTALGLFSAMLVVVYLVGAMAIEPDSLLYAKFQSTRAQSKMD